MKAEHEQLGASITTQSINLEAFEKKFRFN